MDEAYAEARRLGVGHRLAFVLRGQWGFHLLRAEYGTAEGYANEQLELAERTGDAALLADGHYGRGMVHLYRGEFELARPHLTEAYDRYTPRAADRLAQPGGGRHRGRGARLQLVGPVEPRARRRSRCGAAISASSSPSRWAGP